MGVSPFYTPHLFRPPRACLVGEQVLLARQQSNPGYPNLTCAPRYRYRPIAPGQLAHCEYTAPYASNIETMGEKAGRTDVRLVVRWLTR